MAGQWLAILSISSFTYGTPPTGCVKQIIPKIQGRQREAVGI